MSKEKRDRLFKRGRPVIRPFQVFDGEKYHKDFGIVWVAYKKNPFDSITRWHDSPIETPDQLLQIILNIPEGTELLIAEDVNGDVGGFGPVGIVRVHSDGWAVEPHVEFFPWATARNKLASTVAFLQMVRYKKIGVCNIYCLDDSVELMDKACAYGVLHRVGKIPNGSQLGDLTMYSVRGKK